MSRPIMTNDRESQQARRREQRRRELEHASDLRWVMDDPRGRRFVWALLETTNVYGPIFTGNSETFYRLGRRDVGVELLKEIHVSAYAQHNVMVAECGLKQSVSVESAELETDDA